MTVKLPVIGSHVAATAFATEVLTGPGGEVLVLDGNGKITAENGTMAEPRPNALSLLPGNTEERRAECPGSTPTCRAECYVHSLEAGAADTFAIYRGNTEALRRIVAGPLLGEWAWHLAGWIAERAKGGFRWHVSGDLFSEEHADLVAAVAGFSPEVRHWIYTRSFAFVEPLREFSTTRGGNLSINLSCDQDNYAEAVAAARDPYGYEPLRLAYLTVDGTVPADLPEGSTIFPSYPLRQKPGEPAPAWLGEITRDQRAMVCPVDLIGKSERRRCGLTRCPRCLL